MKFKIILPFVIVLILLIPLTLLNASAEEVTKKEITIEISSGIREGIYIGTLVDALPNGKGKFESRNSEGVAWYYEGDFVNGYFQGQGISVWEDGYKYEGAFDKGERNGYGKYYQNTELVTEGT